MSVLIYIKKFNVLKEKNSFCLGGANGVASGILGVAVAPLAPPWRRHCLGEETVPVSGRSGAQCSVASTRR